MLLLILVALEELNVVQDDGGGFVQFPVKNRGTQKPRLKLDFDECTITFIDPKRFSQGHGKYYNMKNDRHGVAVIINNTDFPRHSHRYGSDRDEYNLAQTFTYLGYRIIVCKNFTSGEILGLFKNLDKTLKESNDRDAQKVENDSFVCCILSHGDEGVIIGSDSEPVKLREIETLTRDSKILNSKPKMFFIQACRGKDPGTLPVERIEADSTASTSADFYFCFATVFGEKAYRFENNHKGSWFVIEMCKILCHGATADSLHSDFQIQLNEAVSTNPIYRHGGEGYASEPTCSNQLHKHVHFFQKY